MICIYQRILPSKKVHELSTDVKAFYRYAYQIARYKIIYYNTHKHDPHYTKLYYEYFYAFQDCRKFNKEVADKAYLAARAEQNGDPLEIKQASRECWR